MHVRRTPILKFTLALSLLLPPASAASAQPSPATVSGQVLDSRGRPLSGALIWVKPAVTTGLLTVRTDSQGRYQSPKLPNIPYYAVGYYQTEYHGQSFCLRLAAEKPGGYDAFSPDPVTGVVRNFRLQLSGKIADSSGYVSYLGSQVRLMWKGDYDAGKTVAQDSSVQTTFTPNGPMINGTPGKAVTLKANYGNPIMEDVPVGHYRVSAVEVHADGHKTPLIVGQTDTALAASTSFDFQPSGGCGGSTSNAGRAFLYVARP
ncbi:carboxypeptidase regulatory-like domain-containing protein [Deinococcus sp. Arct2-2]|uniref:carboxypeptidase-like regulatory domain-containing protein n=1 Tax=Deinococcus sp. Arct2-2 TaxID=2568653 RepID=UPI0010A2B52F|nr:carboxypeptidase-like regulatory domain-containing protein [Deinococcus sp. Arct2-2]THF70920.1 carboxypeptidase regulatory-like domain-containing protein [Deinococcus sp. Arct2-2]